MYGQIFQVLIMLNRNTRKFISGFIFRYDPKAEIITMYGKIAAWINISSLVSNVYKMVLCCTRCLERECDMETVFDSCKKILLIGYMEVLEL